MAAAPIHVVYLVYGLEYGGAEGQLMELVGRLPPSRYKRTLVTFTPSRWIADRMKDCAVDVLCLHKRGRADLRWFLRLRRLLADAKPQIVHCVGEAANLWGRLAALSLRPRPAVIAFTGTLLIGLAPWQRLAVRVMSHACECVIGNSEQVVQRLWELGVPKNKTRCIMNGVDLSRFAQPWDRAQVLAGEGLEPGLPLVLSVGRLSPEKGQVHLIAAAKLLHDRRVDAQYAIAGQGPLEGALRDEIARQGLAERFHLLPARPEVAPLLNACTMFVLPSLEEGLSNALAEAMACGKPCVASRVGGCQHLLAGGERGFLVAVGDVQALADRIARYLGDDEPRGTHGRNAAQFIREHHSMERMVRDWEALYEELVSRRR